MGNSQSNQQACPNPLCRALCFGRAPEINDGDEWFGDLPRDKKKKKKRFSSKRSMKTMPILPEVEETEESETSNTIEASEEDDINPRCVSVVSESPSAQPRRSSTIGPIKYSQAKRQPKIKLTFVNGQFVDPESEEGHKILKASLSGESEGSPGSMEDIPGQFVDPESEEGHKILKASLSDESEGSPGSMIGGISLMVKTGHCGILGPDVPSLNPCAVKTIGMMSSLKNGSLSRGKSNSSATSSTSINDSEISEESEANSHEREICAVSSILELGNGHVLTASKCDRVIKMWKVESNASVAFVRDFVGHSVGITCLAKVDEKGRFLSASKDRVMKLWDSRFNCNDTDEITGMNRILLATFDNIDRRSVQSIAITASGTYVRPTDEVDIAMAAAMAKKCLKEGSGSVTKAAQERQTISCSGEFCTISGRHNVVKVWSMKHVEQDGQQEGNVAEVSSEQEIKHDAVVESLASVPDKSMLLTGDRMGCVRLWRSAKNVFLPGSGRIWSCVKTFLWRPKHSLERVEKQMQYAITSLAFLQDNVMFVSGSRSGHLRVWKADVKDEIVKKEVICISGAHSLAVTDVKPGPRDSQEGSGRLSFSSAAKDGKVLSFAIPEGSGNGGNPRCMNVVNHGIVNRYFNAETAYVACLACVSMEKGVQDVVITGIENGSLNVLRPPYTPKEGEQKDALIRYRQAMEEESLTLYAIAEKMTLELESRNRKLMMMTFKECFVGSDAVSFFFDRGYAASREDALKLGHVLATRLSLFECVTTKGKDLVDDSKAYYRFSEEFLGSKKTKFKRMQTAPLSRTKSIAATERLSRAKSMVPTERHTIV